MVNDRTPDAREAYEVLRAVCRADDSSLRAAYRQMRELLELLCRTQTEDGSLQMTDLAARIKSRSGSICCATPRPWPSSSGA